MKNHWAKRCATLALGAVLGVWAVPAHADNDVGCGIGTKFMEGKSGLISHVLASCTNAYTLQSVSLTFNLFGCDGSGKVTADAQLRKFAAANIDQLARDVARGEGETLAALAHLLGVPAEQQATFAGFTQAHFVDLFPTENVDSNQMVDAFYGLIGVTRIEG
jgi:hypothetical protein